MDVEYMKEIIETFNSLEADRLDDSKKKDQKEPFTKERLLDQLWTMFSKSLKVDGHEKGKVPETISRPLFLKTLKQAVKEVHEKVIEATENEVTEDMKSDSSFDTGSMTMIKLGGT